MRAPQPINYRWIGKTAFSVYGSLPVPGNPVLITGQGQVVISVQDKMMGSRAGSQMQVMNPIPP